MFRARVLVVKSLEYTDHRSERAARSGGLMFRHVEGYKAQYGDMSLLVAHEFAEWHVIVIKPPATVIQGGRQFSETKAREHARQLADSYLRDERHEETSNLPSELTWEALQSGDWLAWRP